MEEWIKQNIDERTQLGPKIEGTRRYWRAVDGDEKRRAWSEYISLTIRYKQLMDKFDSEGIIKDHSFQLEPYRKAIMVCHYWPGRNGRNGEMKNARSV